jgi:hypothetical protein
MIKHFTSPEFADLLKQHGIEIDTPFYSFLLKVENDLSKYHIGMFSPAIGYYIATIGWTYNEDCIGQVKPAYLLSEVLTWLPDTVYAKNNFPWKIKLAICDGNLAAGYFDYVNGNFLGNYQKVKPIEQLITQGLTEGWLTKEIIEQQIKQNQ